MGCTKLPFELDGTRRQSARTRRDVALLRYPMTAVRACCVVQQWATSPHQSQHSGDLAASCIAPVLRPADRRTCGWPEPLQSDVESWVLNVPGADVRPCLIVTANEIRVVRSRSALLFIYRVEYKAVVAARDFCKRKRPDR